MSDFKRIEFSTTDGTMLRGDFFQAAGNGVPIIVMTQGLTLLKEHYIEDTARRFQAAGYSVLVYDHRGFGSSDGLPRHEVNPLQQGEDYHDAVTAAMSLPGVDSSRVAIWGIGHSGGAVLIAGSHKDPRIKVVIIHMPFISGARDASAFPKGILDKAFKDREEITKNGKTETTYVKLWPHSMENAMGNDGEQTFLTGPDAYNFITGGLKRSRAAGTPWENKMSLQSFYHISKVEPGNFVSGITSKALYIAAEEDPITGDLAMHKAVYAKAGENVEFALVKPHHLATYFGEPFEENIAVQLEYLKRAL